MGCYLDDYHARVGTWAGRFSWHGMARHGDAIRTSGDCLALEVLSSMVLAELNKILVLLWKCRTPCDSYVLGAAGI